MRMYMVNMVLFKNNCSKIVIVIQSLLVIVIFAWYTRTDNALLKHRLPTNRHELMNKSVHDQGINRFQTYKPNLTVSTSAPPRSHLSTKLDDYMSNRLASIRDTCSGYMQNPYWQNLHQGGRVWTYEQIHYCIVPKVGCTFWKRIMRFVSKDYPDNQNINKPSDIDRSYVHYGNIKNIRQWSVHNPVSQMLMANGKSFMFVRNPFSRLWSAYIDKFLLPDFWRTDARAVVKKVRRNRPEYEDKCANNVTFHEFLLFINMTHKVGLNEHWDKIHRLCSPCHVQYDVIGRQESFGLDADYIMSKYNLEHLKENVTKQDLVREEIVTITKYNFRLESSIQKGCFDKVDVAKRLWLTFQYNGYIHRDSKLPEDNLAIPEFFKTPTEIFLILVFQTLENQNKKGIDLKGQKQSMMLDEYRKIPERLISDIATIYDYDFELFGYNRNVLR
ncbi:carbohydrate sulfotransferase 8-like [Ruditapes philippinarum]|uniref:carbohydrate sulfotransferase 8-like n=1 Tax=Ruditapes philippinarum TaxID=129788 RepID=UPI00295AA338|nr:carbohydrate sulfotransferase 8-like [Ruditapes philippinarum]